MKTVKTKSKSIENKEISLKQMLKSVDDDLKREEIIHILLEQKVSKVIKEEENFKIYWKQKIYQLSYRSCGNLAFYKFDIYI